MAQVGELAARVKRLEAAAAGKPTEEDEYLNMGNLCKRFGRSRWVLGPRVREAVAAGKVRMLKTDAKSHPTYRVRDVEMLMTQAGGGR